MLNEYIKDTVDLLVIFGAFSTVALALYTIWLLVKMFFDFIKVVVDIHKTNKKIKIAKVTARMKGITLYPGLYEEWREMRGHLSEFDIVEYKKKKRRTANGR